MVFLIILPLGWAAVYIDRDDPLGDSRPYRQPGLVTRTAQNEASLWKRRFFDYRPNAVELHPSLEGKQTVWDIPDDEKSVSCVSYEGGCECLNRMACIPCPMISCEKLATPPHYTGVQIKFIKLFPDQSELRRLCRHVRRKVLQVLRALTTLDYYRQLAFEKCDHEESDTDGMFLMYSYLGANVIKPLDDLQAYIGQELVHASETVYAKSAKLLQLQELNSTSVLLTEFMSGDFRLQTEQDWIITYHLSRNGLRYIADYLSFALNQAPYWNCLVKLGFYAQRKTIVVKRGETMEQPNTELTAAMRQGRP